MNNNVLLFADDTKIYTTIDHSNPPSTLQEDIDTCVTCRQRDNYLLHVQV